MTVIIFAALFFAFIVYTLCYYITLKIWYGDLLIVGFLVLCILALLITAFYA